MRSSDDDVARSTELIRAGSDIAGAVVGGAIGLVGGPGGAIGGAAAGVVVARAAARVGSEVQQRLLSPRERMRAGAAFAFAADYISARLLSGDEPRTDGFFDGMQDGRSGAEELLEGVLRVAADAYEEKKVMHLGYLYGSLVFDATVPAGDGNYLLRLARGLTYRQLVMLSMFGRPETQTLREEISDDVWHGRVVFIRPAVVEIEDLGEDGLLAIIDDSRETTVLPTFRGFPQVLGTRPFRHVELSPGGETLYRLMRLDQIPLDAIEEMVHDLVQSR